jgi:hypothetical protein
MKIVATIIMTKIDRPKIEPAEADAGAKILVGLVTTIIKMLFREVLVGLINGPRLETLQTERPSGRLFFEGNDSVWQMEGGVWYQTACCNTERF